MRLCKQYACLGFLAAVNGLAGAAVLTARIALDPKAQPYQKLIDTLFYRMAGLTEDEAAGLEDRLGRML